MISRRSFRLSAFACAAALAGAACGGASDGGNAAGPAAESAPSATEPGATVGESDATAGDGAVPTLLQFTAPLVGGGEFAGDQFADKPTAFWFWSPT